MTYHGHVKNGMVLLDVPATLPEGAAVRVELITRPEDSATEQTGATLYDRLRPMIGAARGLPSDLAENHDHYLHGQPKQR